MWRFFAAMRQFASLSQGRFKHKSYVLRAALQLRFAEIPKLGPRKWEETGETLIMLRGSRSLKSIIQV